MPGSAGETIAARAARTAWPSPYGAATEMFIKRSAPPTPPAKSGVTRWRNGCGRQYTVLRLSFSEGTLTVSEAPGGGAEFEARVPLPTVGAASGEAAEVPEAPAQPVPFGGDA